MNSISEIKYSYQSVLLLEKVENDVKKQKVESAILTLTIDLIPYEMIEKILSFVPKDELYNVSFVSRSFNIIVSSHIEHYKRIEQIVRRKLRVLPKAIVDGGREVNSKEQLERDLRAELLTPCSTSHVQNNLEAVKSYERRSGSTLVEIATPRAPVKSRATPHRGGALNHPQVKRKLDFEPRSFSEDSTF